MKQELDKCVLVIDEAMPRGLAANTAAILGITWGRLRPELVGEDVTDAAGAIHPGIIRTPVPVLSGRPETFQTLRRQLAELEFADVAAVDFTDLAQSCRTYGEFIEKMARTGPGELRYLGMALLGPRHQVDRLTGSLPLLRKGNNARMGPRPVAAPFSYHFQEGLWPLLDQQIHLSITAIGVQIAAGKAVRFPDGIRHTIVLVVCDADARNLSALLQCAAVDSADVSTPILDTKLGSVRIVHLSHGGVPI